MGYADKVVNKKNIIAFIAFVVFGSSPIYSVADSEPKYKSKYIGQEKREIKSLSAQDIEELKAGGGWGFAKTAELNGLPGPKHILEMKNEIGLTSDQEKRVVELYNHMKKQAVRLGHQLIELENELDHGFANKTIDKEKLRALLDKIGDIYKKLRFVHLSAHLKTPDVLSPSQIEKYNKLRGYSSDDPCKNVPKGHDPAMWRRHNDCP